MALVYLARDLKHDRFVALKVLRPELSSVLGPDRFMVEIRLTAKLQHPHILPLLDSGEAGGFLYYAMPHVQGESLRHLLEREGQLSLEETLRLTRAVAAALDYAHGLGVIHRDIKPENILLYQGEPLVADFGIALAVSQAGRDRLTETGLSLGTPAYMSPEQASAEARLDGRSDQYSLACVVYELLAGEPPYTGPTARAIIAKRLSEPIPHLSTLRAVPAAVETAIMRALSKSPADRFATIGEFSAALNRYSEVAPDRKHDPMPRPIGLPWRQTVTAITAVGVLALVAVLSMRHRPPGGPPVQRQITFTGKAQSPSISPDGKWLAYFSADSGARGFLPSPDHTLRIQPLPSGDPITLAESVYGGQPPAWSPDGANLLFNGVTRSVRGVLTVGRVGGQARRIIPASWIYRYRPDGRAILRATFDTLVVNDLATGAEVHRFSLAGKMDFVQTVDWAAAGGWIAVGGTHAGKSLIALVKPDGTGFRALADNGYSPLWGADGGHLYFLRTVSGGADLLRFAIDQKIGQERGPPRLVLSGLPVSASGVSVNKDATTLVYEKAVSDVHIWATMLDGPLGAFRPRSWQLTSGTRRHATPDLSADGRSVTFVRGESGAESLFVLPFAGTSSPRWIPTPSGRVFQPRWAPDGSRIAFGLQDSSATAVFIAALAGDSLVKAGARQPTIFPMIAWSPDGNRLVFAVEGLRELVLINLAEGRDKRLGWKSTDRVIEPRFSPDGKEILATSYPDINAPDALARTTVGSDRWVRTGTAIRNIRLLRWTPDGWVYAAVFPGPRQRTAIYRMQASGGSLKLYTELPIECDFQQVAMAANARQFVCAVERSRPDVWMVQNFDLDRQ